MIKGYKWKLNLILIKMKLTYGHVQKLTGSNDVEKFINIFANVLEYIFKRGWGKKLKKSSISSKL